jgi:hypothetical protein
VVRKMDLFLSVPLVLMDDGFQRKAIYGKAGAFRKKPYGVEYRTPSNWWCAPGETEEERQKRCEWVWRNTEKALHFDEAFMDDDGDNIIKCINNNDKVMAKELINAYELEVL